jgi:ATPase family associated with various cellular activities (AAA)
MMNLAQAANAHDLELDLDWLARVLQMRMAAYFGTPSASPVLPDADTRPPALRGDSAWAAFLREHAVAPRARLVLLLALAPALRPALLDALTLRNESTQRGFAEFGGQAGSGGAFVPTLQTACFLVAGDALGERFALLASIAAQAPWTRALAFTAGTDPAQPLLPDAHALLRFTHGDADAAPPVADGVAARRVTTGLAWSDLVLPDDTLAQLEEVRDWVRHSRALLDDWGLRDRIRPGHTALFHGPPGTGKTLAACLIGKLCEREVHRIDLSLVVSKYIGETEKNLARLFEAAERQGWILFFDEADALFGKRTAVGDAHDRYANQEVSYLLQRIEDFAGVVILASNLRSNIDEAFVRRFQTVVAFPTPRAGERLRLWRESFSRKAELDAALDLERLAQRHELTGGTIVNVVRWASLRALARGERCVRADDVDQGIRRELQKEGRAF